MLPEDAYRTCSLKQEAFEFGKHRAIPVHLVVNLVTVGVSGQDAHVDEPTEFALNGSVTDTHKSDDLSKVEGLIGMGKEKRQDCLSGPAEQGRR